MGKKNLIERFQIKLADKVKEKLNLESEELYGEKFRKFADWWLYDLPKIIKSVVSFIVLFIIFRWLGNEYGVEYVYLVAIVSIVVMLRKTSAEVREINEKLPEK